MAIAAKRTPEKLAARGDKLTLIFCGVVSHCTPTELLDIWPIRKTYVFLVPGTRGPLYSGHYPPQGVHHDII